MKKKIQHVLVLSLLIVGVLLFAGCGKKKKIENFKIDADYALQHGNYEDARKAYNEILALDKEDRTAIYGLKDLEEIERQHDSNLMANLHMALCDAIAGHELDMEKGFKIPKPGDYSLVEFVNEAGSPCAHYVYDNRLNVADGNAFQSQLVSYNKDGKKLSENQVRVAFYNYSKESGIEICVYVTESENTTGDFLAVGAKYNPSFNYSNSKLDPTIIGVHSHAFLVNEAGEQVGSAKEKEILHVRSSTPEENQKFATPLNEAEMFQVLTTDNIKPLNLLTIGGCVLYDGFGNYYMEVGLISDGCYELMCITESEARSSVNYTDVGYTSYPRWNKK